MEGSPHETGGTAPDPHAPAGRDPAAPAGPAPAGAPARPAGPDTGAAGGPDPDPPVTGQADPGVSGGPDDEEPDHAPAEDQAPAAHAAATVGDPGLHGEQQPTQAEGSPSNVDRAVGTSAPPPSAQSGVPLVEDRQAGVEPGPAGPIAPGSHEAAEDEAKGE